MWENDEYNNNYFNIDEDFVTETNSGPYITTITEHPEDKK